MREEAAALEFELPRARPRVFYYFALTKPRVVSMVLVTTLTGFYMSAGATWDVRVILDLIVGTAVAAGGTLALNQYLERDLDARMYRTRGRPLPAGNLTPAEALWFGIILTICGIGYLYYTVNPLTAALTGAITIVYLLVYTPLKRISSICSVVGAIPGALPPVAGWAAARGTLSAPAWVLFGIMFLWQLPHSLAIAQLYREDYQRAGIRLLPTEDPSCRANARQIVSNSLALLAVAMLPTVMGVAGVTYWAISLGLGLLLLYFGVKLFRTPTAAAAKRVMIASLVYLPVVLIAMLLDKIH